MAKLGAGSYRTIVPKIEISKAVDRALRSSSSAQWSRRNVVADHRWRLRGNF
jgi:hypothetical protein